MPRIEPVRDDVATEAERANIDSIVGRVTNMKRTLARSRVALDALLQWYPLHDAVLPFLGRRAVSVFCHAISAQSDCLICSTYFRRELIEAGENPDNLALDEREMTLVAFGRQLAKDANDVDDDLYAKLVEHFTDDQLIELTAFGAMMIATNVFNDALRVDLDDELGRYRLPRVALTASDQPRR